MCTRPVNDRFGSTKKRHKCDRHKMEMRAYSIKKNTFPSFLGGYNFITHILGGSKPSCFHGFLGVRRVGVIQKGYTFCHIIIYLKSKQTIFGLILDI